MPYGLSISVLSSFHVNLTTFAEPGSAVPYSSPNGAVVIQPSKNPSIQDQTYTMTPDFVARWPARRPAFATGGTMYVWHRPLHSRVSCHTAFTWAGEHNNRTCLITSPPVNTAHLLTEGLYPHREAPLHLCTNRRTSGGSKSSYQHIMLKLAGILSPVDARSASFPKPVSGV